MREESAGKENRDRPNGIDQNRCTIVVRVVFLFTKPSGCTSVGALSEQSVVLADRTDRQAGRQVGAEIGT